MEKPDRPPREAANARKPLRVVVAEIDREILGLLVRRTNLIDKMREKGRLPVNDERYLRESWQNDVSRVSRDPELSGRFFSLMQQVSFLPRPGKDDSGSESAPGSRRREAFNLAPPRVPIAASLRAPLSGHATRAWLYLAAASGQPLRLAPCLQNDQLVDFVQGLAQMGAAITREEDAIVVRVCAPLSAPDKVIHTGADEANFYFFAAHYLGRYSRVKFTGAPALQLADFSLLRQFLPKLGARLVNIVPKSDGLPVRLESSGILPPGIDPDPDLPAGFVEALVLAAPFYSEPLDIDLSRQPKKNTIIAHTLPILEASGAVFSLEGDTLAIEPSQVKIPVKPALPLDAELGAFLLSFAPALGGNVRLEGIIADWPENAALWQLCLTNGFKLEDNGIAAFFAEPSRQFDGANFSPGADWQKSLASALAACAFLHGGSAQLPAAFAEDQDCADFFRACGLQISPAGILAAAEMRKGTAWNAPAPAWAMALALAACARKGNTGWPLGNPGILMDLWPSFWGFYNSLPEPRLKRHEEKKSGEARSRRRILTSAVAVPPEIREEDWN